MKEFKDLYNEFEKTCKEYYKIEKKYKKLLKEIASYTIITPDDKKDLMFKGGIDGRNK